MQPATNHPQGPGYLIAIFGISGSGKTTLGQELARRLGFTFVDLDDFYRLEKPSVQLSNGHIKKNWDTLEAIDIPAFKKKLRTLTGGVVVVGFALTDALFEKKPNAVIWLQTGRNRQVVVKRAIAARQKSKPGINPVDDALMVQEYVYPFFQQNLHNISITANLDVYTSENDDTRRSLDELVEILLNYLDLYP